MKSFFQNRHGVKETMHMSWLLFKEQMHYIRISPAAILVCVGILFLPSLYAWFNIAASWSPYDYTNNLKVGVTNLDKGAEIDGVHINIGDKVIDGLKKNDRIGWQFVDYEEAMEEVNAGEYYAALVIPEDFSGNMTSFLRANVHKASIEYYVNEKLNAISPKVMSTGMTTVQTQVNETFIKTISDISLNALKLADGKYMEYKPTLSRMLDTMDLTAANMNLFIANMNDFQNMLNQANELSKDAESILPKAAQGLKDASALTTNAQNTLQQAKSTVYNIDRLVDQDVASLTLIAGQIETDANSLSNMGASDLNSARSSLQNMSDKIDQLSTRVQRLSNTLERFNRMLPIPLSNVNDFITRLDTLDTQLNTSANNIRTLRNNLGKGSNNMTDVANQAINISKLLTDTINESWTMYNGSVAKSMADMTNQMANTLDDTYAVLQSTSGLIPKVDGVLGTIRGMGPTGTDTLNRFKESLVESQKLLSKATGDIRGLTEDEEYSKVLNFIRQDVETASSFLSDPIELKTHRVYPVPNYGSGMSPFYSVLAIWVGCLLIMAMIGVINEKGLKAYPNVSVTPMYLSRLALYQLLSFFQSAIIAVGDLFVMDIHCLHPWLFLMLCVLIGQVFAIFIFSLVFTFSELGKALAIITLVLQIAASGGTFPIEMTPQFFQIVHPLLPFTYCIGAMREVCAGIYWHSLLVNIAIMSLIPIASVAIVVIFGPALRQFTKAFERSMKRSGLH